MKPREILLNIKNRIITLNGKYSFDENANPKDVFLQEKEECDGPFYHVMGGIKDSALIEIDKWFGVADKLSLENAKKHKKILLTLSVLGPLISVVFFLYFEGEIHGMIFLCIILIAIIYWIHQQSNNLDCHRKYLEYRVLAETIRVQFYLSMKGSKLKAEDISPWFIQKAIPWIGEILHELPLSDVKENRRVIYYWAFDQKTYHEGALLNAENKRRRQEKIRRIAIYITIFAYFLGVVFELFMYSHSPDIDAHMIRLGLKIVIGFMSVSLIFLESYYGKMSLSETINDHKRMILLYAKIKKDISVHGETDEILYYLAKEFLIENSTWYAYQSKNKAELVF